MNIGDLFVAVFLTIVIFTIGSLFTMAERPCLLCDQYENYPGAKG